jgi:5-methylcytosine-specific restriction endonuclease McrA
MMRLDPFDDLPPVPTREIMRWSFARPLGLSLVDLYARYHNLLIGTLGGKCARCGSHWRLEVDHVDGATWSRRDLGSQQRIVRYFEELAAGIPLRVLCRNCNPREWHRQQRRQRNAHV